MGIIAFLRIGALAGWLARNFMKGNGFSLLGNIIVGIIGAFIGGLVLGLVGVDFGGFIGSLVTATIGAVILLFIVSRVKKNLSLSLRINSTKGRYYEKICCRRFWYILACAWWVW
jgi:uncharacterized membrane protein YeaQ/YmgE (transglycosylase-associated protein family)